MSDYDRTLTTVTEAEAFRAKSDGAGTNLQGQAVTRHYRELLADLIGRLFCQAGGFVPGAVPTTRSHATKPR
jgi:hypothetical protein